MKPNPLKIFFSKSFGILPQPRLLVFAKVLLVTVPGRVAVFRSNIPKKISHPPWQTCWKLSTIPKIHGWVYRLYLILPVRLPFFCRKFLKKTGYSTSRMFFSQFSILQKDKKFVDKLTISKHQLLNPPTSKKPFFPTFMWPDRPSSCLVFTIFSSVFFSGTTSGTRRSSMAPAIVRISAVNAKLHLQTWKMTETAQQEILLLVVSFLFSKFGESTKNRTEGLQQSRNLFRIKSGSILQQISSRPAKLRSPAKGETLSKLHSKKIPRKSSWGSFCAIKGTIPKILAKGCLQNACSYFCEIRLAKCHPQGFGSIEHMKMIGSHPFPSRKSYNFKV